MSAVVEAEASELLRGADPETLLRTWRSVLCPVDAAVLTTGFADFVLRTVREGMGETRDGLIDDDMAFVTPWGFELSQIRVPVLLLHGEHDQMVPISHGRWLASRITNVEARFLPNDGHLTLSLRRIPEVRLVTEQNVATASEFSFARLQKRNGTRAFVRAMYSGYPGKRLVRRVSSCRSLIQRPQKQMSRATKPPTSPTNRTVPRIISSSPE